jgi:hypothetical protein
MVALSFHAALALAVPLFAAPQTTTAPARFRVVPLDSLGGAGIGLREQARAINEHGAVVGNVVHAGNSIAAHWKDDGSLTLLVNGQPDASSFGYDVSDDGIAVGRSVGGTTSDPFQWTASSGKQSLGLSTGAVPLAINGFQTIAYTFPSGDSLASATWRLGVNKPIAAAAGDVIVRDINALGAVAGIFGGGELPARAFRWSPSGGLVSLDVPLGFDHAHGNGINAANVVVGLSRRAARDQATRWSPGSASVLLGFANPAFTRSAAMAVNADGWIVGTEDGNPLEPEASQGVIWIDDRPSALNELLAPLPHGVEVHVTAAFDINDAGQIAARGYYNGVERALRLDP